MARIVLPSRPILTAPAVGNGTDLARELVGAWVPAAGGGGTVPSLILPLDALVMQGSGLWRDSPAGRGIHSGGNSSGARLASPSAILKPATAVTLVVYAVWMGGGAIASNPAIAAMYENPTAAAPFLSYGIQRHSGSSTGLKYAWNDGTYREIAVTPILTALKPFVAGLTVGASGAFAYFNGRQVGTSASVGTIQYTSPRFDVGRHVNGTPDPDTVAVALYVWKRPLTPDEHIRLALDPFAVLTSRRWWTVRFGVAHALAGTSLGTGAQTGALREADTVAGASQGTGTQTGGVRVARALAATSIGTGMQAGALVEADTIAGTSSGAGLASGAVVVARSLATVSLGTGGATADLTVAGPTIPGDLTARMTAMRALTARLDAVRPVTGEIAADVVVSTIMEAT